MGSEYLLIALFGPDGSGKSTLAKALAERLSQRGIKVKVIWMRGTHTLASATAKLLARIPSFKGSDNPYYNIHIPKGFRRMWQLIEFISVLPILAVKFLLPSFFIAIIAERYIIDFLVWVSITTNDDNYVNKFEAKFLMGLAFKPTIKVYVTANLEELCRRRREDVNFLKKQLKLYGRMTSSICAYRLDTTNKNLQDSLKEVLNLLNMYC